MLDVSHAIGSTRSRYTPIVELDSHADNCVVGKYALLIHEHPNVVMVSGFDPLLEPKKGVGSWLDGTKPTVLLTTE